jgi:hypothetical protein
MSMLPVTITDSPTFKDVEYSSGVNGGVFHIERVSFVDNTGTTIYSNITNDGANGGAFYASYSSITMENAQFSSIESDKEGGAFYLIDCIIDMSSVSFNGIKAGEAGGVFYAEGSSSISISTSYFLSVVC